MNKKIIESIIYIIVGTVILLAIEFKFIQFAELINIILGFIGFAALLNGLFGLYSTFSSKSSINKE